jgi:hypothetical protein
MRTLSQKYSGEASFAENAHPTNTGPLLLIRAIPREPGAKTDTRPSISSMGLFRSSGAAAAKKAERHKVLINKKKSSGSIDLKASSSSDDHDDEGGGGAGEQQCKVASKPKFWRLHEELVGEDHRKPNHLEPPPPPSTFSSSTVAPKEAPQRIKKTPRKKQNFQKLESVDEKVASVNTPSKKDAIKKTPTKSSKKIKRANLPLHALPSLDEQSEGQGLAADSTLQRQRIKTSTSVDSATTASIAEYQPPPAFLAAHPIQETAAKQQQHRHQHHHQHHPTATKSSTVVSMAGVVVDKKSSRQFQSFMHDRIAASFSDDTLDNNNNGGGGGMTTIPTTNSDAASGLYSESGFPTSQGGHKFQQIVFDHQFHQIEKVKAAKSGTILCFLPFLFLLSPRMRASS